MRAAGQDLRITRAAARTTRGRRRRRGRRLVAGFVAVGAITTAAVVAVALSGGRAAAADSCTVSSSGGGQPYSLNLDQAQNAAIIAAVAYKKGLPDHAVTVGLAAALQESQLRNLPYGDLDSLGLFQQRPSEGWGTPSQILDPIYATAAFYDHLAQISGWESMAVTDAAQMVQHSAAPSAYAAWEGEARALAVALTGESGAGFSCHFAKFGGAAPAPSALTLAADSELGVNLIGVPVSTKVGWRVAAWAVAHAYNYHVNSVAFGGLIWTAHRGTWSSAPSGKQPGVVSIT